MPELRMAQIVYFDILYSIGSRAPETGGILLGPVGSNNAVTDYYFDHSADCSGGSGLRPG